jgi:opine dehydrogenase
MVVVPTIYQGSVARAMAPFLTDGQVIVLHPGATGGALEVRAAIRDAGAHVAVTVAETDTLLYACRSPRAGEAIIYGMKDRVHVATLPAAEAPRVAHVLCTAFPQYKPVGNVLVTSLMNANAMMHPAPTLLNAGRIESQTSFEYYSGGITPSIARVVEAIDAERMAVAKALDVRVPSITQWYTACYGVTGQDLCSQVQQVKAYEGIKGPTTLNTRYLFEDIPTGLVPLSLLGRTTGIATPIMESVVTLGNALLGRDFWREGRSLEKLGLAGKSPTEIHAVIAD